MFRALAIMAACFVACPTPGEACSKRHQTPFELFDEATTVALVNVRATPSGSATRIEAGDAELAVTRVIKGAKTRVLLAVESNTSCRAGYVLGSDIVVMLGDNGFTVGAHDGHLRDVAWAPVLDAWAQASDADARAAVLVDVIAGKHQKIADEAMTFLLDAPALLNAVTAEQTQRIATAAKAMPKDWKVAMLLARLRDPSAPSRANVAVWANAAKRFLEVNETETDTDKLADKIEKRRHDRDPHRIAAMERCERVRGVSLFVFAGYFAGAGSPQMWQALADACRTGKPAR